MAKIVLYLPANTFHSFLREDRWGRMSTERMGLCEIGKSGIPVTVSHQGIDYELCPYLEELLRQYASNIEVAGAPYGHPLLPLFENGQTKYVGFETAYRARVSTLPVTFFPEFATPGERFIPTRFFFVLKNQTVSYSMTVGVGKAAADWDLVVDPLPRSCAVRFGKKIGLVLDGYEGFLKTWFAYAAVPTQTNLEALMEQFAAMANDPRPFIIVPLDLEQPYVGSALGAHLWTLFFDELKERGLDRHIVPLSSILGDVEGIQDKLPSIRQPERVYAKWTIHRAQLNHLDRLKRLAPANGREFLLYSLAGGSDFLSSCNRHVLQSRGASPSVTCQDLEGNKVIMSQGPNLHLQEVSLAAWDVLRHGDKTLARRIVERIAANADCNGMNAFAEAIVHWAADRNV